MELSGTITSGDGAGDVIRVTSYAGLPTFHCRIVAVSATGLPRAESTGPLSARTASSGQP